MPRAPSTNAGDLDEFNAKLVALMSEARQLQATLDEAYVSRTSIGPLVHKRDMLKQRLSDLNSQVQSATKDNSNPATIDGIRGEADLVHRQIAECTQQIEKGFEPFQCFSQRASSFINGLRSALRFLPISDKASKLREEIEKLPLLREGLTRDPQGPQDDLEAIELRLAELSTQSKQKALLPRLDVPAGLKWEDVEIRFLTEETIHIKYQGVRRNFGFADLGFEDARSKGTPDGAWIFLRELATAPNNEIVRHPIAPAVAEKRVETLRKRLRTILGLGDDPFFSYRKEHCYRPRFKVSFPGRDHA